MPVTEQPATAFRITVGGTPLRGDVERELRAAVVDTDLNLPDLFVLTFRDQHRDLLSRAGLAIGSEVSIAAVSDGHPGGEVLTTGEVTSLEAELDVHGTFTVVRGYDRSHRLLRGRTTREFVDMSYADVVRAVVAAAGVPLGEIDDTPPQPVVSQVNETDWDLVRRLALEVGFETGVVGGRFVFRRATDAAGAPAVGTARARDPLQLVAGSDLVRCRATVTAADQVPRVQVRAWDMRAKRALVGREPARTANARNGSDPARLAGVFGARDHVTVDIPFGSQREVDAAASALAEAIAGASAELDGVARGNPRLRAGTAVSLGMLDDPFDGRYVVSAARHTWEPDEGYRVAFSVSGRRDRSLRGLVAGAAPGGGGRSTVGAPTVAGVVPAIVTDVRDPEELGRVRVTYPWLADDFVSDWARVAQVGAGPGRGWLVLPEVGDEVLVAFHHGDVRQPYVLGGLFNGQDRPAPRARTAVVDRTAGAVERRTFVSRRGHALCFVDEAGRELVELTTGDDGHRVRLDQGGTRVVVESSGRVEITAAGDVSIASTGGDVDISGRRVTVSASDDLRLRGGPTAELSARQVRIN